MDIESEDLLAGIAAKCTQKRHERFGDPAEQDSQEEGERQYRMYQSDRKGTEGKTKKTQIYIRDNKQTRSSCKNSRGRNREHKTAKWDGSTRYTRVTGRELKGTRGDIREH